MTKTKIKINSSYNKVNLLNLENSILHESVIFIPIITQSIEKAINQFTQMSVLHEALSTSIFLVSLVASEPSLGI